MSCEKCSRSANIKIVDLKHAIKPRRLPNIDKASESRQQQACKFTLIATSKLQLMVPLFLLLLAALSAMAFHVVQQRSRFTPVVLQFNCPHAHCRMNCASPSG